MGRSYHYDLDQFVDSEGNLLFLTEHIQHINGTKLFLFINPFGNKIAYPDSYENILTKVQLTYKDVVIKVCEFYDYGHKNPMGFKLKLRSAVILLCHKLSYQEVNERHRPTLKALADIFELSIKGVHNVLGRGVTTKETGEFYDILLPSFTKYISVPITE